jgi:hypothetical protein
MQPITLRDIVVQAGPERFGEIPTSQRPSAIQRTHTAHDTVSSRRIVVPRAWWWPARHVTSDLNAGGSSRALVGGCSIFEPEAVVTPFGSPVCLPNGRNKSEICLLTCCADFVPAAVT